MGGIISSIEIGKNAAHIKKKDAGNSLIDPGENGKAGRKNSTKWTMDGAPTRNQHGRKSILGPPYRVVFREPLPRLNPAEAKSN